MTHEIRKYRTDFEFGRLLDEEEMNSLLHMAEDLAQLYLFLGREFDVKVCISYTSSMEFFWGVSVYGWKC